MNTTAATGKRPGSDQEFLNVDKLKNDMAQLIENGKVLVAKLRQVSFRLLYYFLDAACNSIIFRPLQPY